MSSLDHERYEVLLVKAVDSVLDSSERAELDAHLAGCPSCRAELADFRLIKETTDGMRARILADARIEPPRPAPPARALLGLGFGLLLAGAVVGLGFTAYRLALDPNVPSVVKIGVASAAMGALLLFGYVLRIRWRAHLRDPYEEIDR